MKTSDVLGKAAHLVLERGLAKRVYENGAHECCARGAVCIADAGGWVDSDADIDIFGMEGADALAAWNDREETTAEDVASLLMSEAEVVE